MSLSFQHKNINLKNFCLSSIITIQDLNFYFSFKKIFKSYAINHQVFIFFRRKLGREVMFLKIKNQVTIMFQKLFSFNIFIGKNKHELQINFCLETISNLLFIPYFLFIKINFNQLFQFKIIYLNPFPILFILLNFLFKSIYMIESPFLQQIHLCKGVMKKLRKKIYKFNINKHSKPKKQDSTIKDALTVLSKRTIPDFLIDQLQKYSDLTFSSLSGFSLRERKPLDQISNLTNIQEKQIQNIYHENKKTIKKRRSVYPVMKLNRRETQATEFVNSFVSSTNISNIFDQQDGDSQYESNQQSQVFQPIGNSNTFDQDFNNSDAMFQSTMLDFGNQVDMDSEQFLFKC